MGLSGLVYVSALTIVDDRWERVQIPTHKNCDHVESICWECADAWAIDYQLNPTSTVAARNITGMLNKRSPDVALMNGEIDWRK
jgi:hypothetical protein